MGVHDFPYGNIDNDPFMDVSIGRLVGKNQASLFLITSRISTYEHLRDSLWDENAAIVGDLQQALYVMSPVFENVGFVTDRLKNDQIPSTMERAAIYHNAHSSYNVLGGFFNSWSQTLLAPAVVTSSGCSPAGIDRAGPDRAVALHLLHQGAVAFLGAPHNAVTRGKLTHQAFWKAVIEGKTIGEAFTEAMNNWIVVVEE